MNLKTYLDPDRRVFARDKYLHGLAGFAVAVVLGLGGASLFGAWAWTVALGVAFELGQLDTARNPDLEIGGEPVLGHEGFGFGLLDLAWDAAGALVAVALRGVT